MSYIFDSALSEMCEKTLNNDLVKLLINLYGHAIISTSLSWVGKG